MRWRCRGRNEVTGVANVQVRLPEIKVFPFNSTNKKLLPLQPVKSLKTSVFFTLSSVSFFYFFPLFFLFFSLPTHRNFSGPDLFPHSLSLFLKLSPSFPLAFTVLTKFLPRIQREVPLFFSSFGFYIRPLCSSSFHSFSHAFRSGKQTLQPRNHTPQ